MQWLEEKDINIFRKVIAESVVKEEMYDRMFSLPSVLFKVL